MSSTTTITRQHPSTPWSTWVLLCGLILAIAACGDDSSDSPADTETDSNSTTGTTDGTTNTTDATSPVEEVNDDPTGMGYFPDGGFVLGDSHVNVIRTIDVIAQLEPGVAEGFDLDGRVSEEGDEETCGHGDLMSPEGVSGVDNQLAEMWSALEPLIGEASRALLQGSINEGRILVMLEMVGLDDLRNDDSVTFNLYQGKATPDIGTKGLLVPSQTYLYDADFPSTTMDNIQVVDGEAIVGPMSMTIPLDVLNVYYVLELTDVWFRIQIHEDGTFHGYFSGALDVFDLLEELYMSNAAAEAMLVAPVLETNTDLNNVNGQCTRLSTAFSFEGTTAFVVRPESLRPAE
ncbi:MAG: hypothetical protein AAFS10_04820 [Myxococcota bacterium]